MLRFTVVNKFKKDNVLAEKLTKLINWMYKENIDGIRDKVDRDAEEIIMNEMRSMLKILKGSNPVFDNVNAGFNRYIRENNIVPLSDSEKSKLVKKAFDECSVVGIGSVYDFDPGVGTISWQFASEIDWRHCNEQREKGIIEPLLLHKFTMYCQCYNENMKGNKNEK